MNITHQRKMYHYAIAFLVSEIKAISDSLKKDHLLDVSRTLLEKRLKELQTDLTDLQAYDF